MNIIFLDIDGVLCVDAFSDKFQDSCMFWLRETIKVTKAKIVLSSDWRWSCPGQARIALDGLPLIGETPVFPVSSNSLEMTRMLEIAAWLNEQKEIHSWVAVDDMWLPMPNLVQTDWKFGFDRKAANAVSSILTKSPFHFLDEIEKAVRMGVKL